MVTLLARGASVGGQLMTAERKELHREGRTIVGLLQNYHYTDRQLHDIDGSAIIQRFISALDPTQSLFLESDVEFLHHRFDRVVKSVYLLKGDAQPAFEIFDRAMQRAEERRRWIEAQLDQGIDISGARPEAEATYPEGQPAPSVPAANARWERRLRRALIDEMLAGRSRAAAEAAVRKRYLEWVQTLAGYDALAVRARFWESVVNLFDPHSGYFSADGAAEFDQIMNGAVAGVGLDVRVDNGRCLVAGLIAGGPAEQQSELLPQDELIAVAAGEEAWTPLAGRPLRQTVQRLRGAPGTTLRIAYRHPESGRRECTLTRARVILPDERARGSWRMVGDAAGRPHKIGEIVLPAFYAAGADAADASATRDVRELIEQLKEAGIEALVLDLRENGGGAMTEAAGIAGLFVADATVAFTEGADGVVHELKTAAVEPIFDGPVVLVVSGRSASASEVFAGALQFHQRAVVVGNASTFGKGTAQHYINLNELPVGSGGSGTWGTLRLTRERFSCPDGRTPQCAGVSADIVLPFTEVPDGRREVDEDGALVEKTLRAPAPKAALGKAVAVVPAEIERLDAASKKRREADPEFAWEKRRQELMTEAREEYKNDVTWPDAQQERERRDRQLLALRAERQHLLTLNSDAATPCDIAAVSDVCAAHDEAVRAARPLDTAEDAGWLRGGIFYLDGRGARLREAPLGRIDFLRLRYSAEVLATAFCDATGVPVETERMATALMTVALLEAPTDAEVRAKFAEAAFETPPGDPVVRRGLAATLAKALELDPAPLTPGMQLDVVRREARRIAADASARK